MVWFKETRITLSDAARAAGVIAGAAIAIMVLPGKYGDPELFHTIQRENISERHLRDAP